MSFNAGSNQFAIKFESKSKGCEKYCRRIFVRQNLVGCLSKVFKRYLFLLSGMALILLTSIQMVWAQAKEADRVQLKNWYANYNKSQYVIEMPFSQDNAKNLRQRMRRFHYRLIYLPAEPFQNPETAIMRVGFFESKKDATEFLEVSEFLFSEQTIVRVARNEHQGVIAELSKKAVAASKNKYYVFPINPESNDFFSKTISAILEHAKGLYMDKQYEQAASHYHLLSSIADEQTAAWAKELLGLCYEKLKKYDFAINTYSQILNEFPDAKGYARVDQRLRSLQTAASESNAAFRKSSYGEQGKRYFTRGVIAQHYRSLTRRLDGGDSEELMSLLSTNFDVRASGRWADHELRARTSGYSIQDRLDGADTELRLNRAFIDYVHKKTGINVLLGRLKDFDSGVFAPFDGLTVSYPVLDNLSVSVSTGEPVYFTDVYEDLDYYFYSAQVEWNIKEYLKTNAYYNKQTLFDVTDREAIGVRTHFYKEKITASLNIDYDIAFAELNNLLSSASYKLNEKMNVSATLGHQRSPFLTATNILIGQSDLDLELYLESKQNKDSLLGDALNRTALNQYLSLSYNYKFNDKLRMITDYYQSNLSDIPSSSLLLGEDDVSAQEETDDFNQKAVGVQFINQGVFYRNDSATLGVRLRTGNDSRSTQVFFNERLRFGSIFSVSPKITYLVMSFDTGRAEQQQFRYSLSMSYKPFKNTELNLEAGNEHFDIEESNFSYNSTYFFLGYRFNF